MNVDKSNKISLLKSLCRDIRDDVSIERFIGFDVDEELSNFNIYLNAIECDNVELLRYMTKVEKCTDYQYTSTELYEHMCEFDISSYLVKYKLYECINYMCTSTVPKFVDGYIYCLNEDTCSKAARAGSFECLKYAHENGCEMNKFISVHSVKAGSFECLKYVYE